MTHHRASFEKAVVLTTSASARMTEAAFQQLADKTFPLPIEVVIQRAAHGVEARILVGACWEGDWRSKLSEWTRLAQAQIGRKMLDVDSFRRYCASFDDVWRIVGSAELWESAFGHMDVSISTISKVLLRNAADTELDPTRLSQKVGSI